MRAATGCFVGLMLAACSAASNDDPTAAGVGGSAGDGNTGGTANAGGAASNGASGAISSAGGNGMAGNGTAAGGAAGKPTAGGSGGSSGGGLLGDGGVGVAAKCGTPVGPGLPPGAPVLTKGTWKDISPAGVNIGTGPIFTQGMAVDPCNPGVLFLTVSAFDSPIGGLFKSIDAGSTWKRVAKVTTGVGYIDEPIRVRIDPKNTQHMYVGDGVRGSTQGFWVSMDGGETFIQPKGFVDIQNAPDKLFAYDVYDVAVDPTDFNHVLLSFHSMWGDQNTKWKGNAGVLESKDGGTTWMAHPPVDGFGQGDAIHFLYKPELGVGDANTWLFSTQAGTRYRTKDGGQNWTKITDTGIVHGGGTLYYTKAGVLYASGYPKNVRSTDNGVTWTPLDGPDSTAIFGDGTNLYTGKTFGPAPVLISPESDGLKWTAYNTQQFAQGPFELAYDSINGILYNASWTAGIWALKP